MPSTTTAPILIWTCRDNRADPDLMYRRKVLHLIDNTVALSKSVHGYANEPDMAAVVNSLTCATPRSASRRGSSGSLLFEDPSLMLASARALADGVAADRQRSLSLLCGLIGGPP